VCVFPRYRQPRSFGVRVYAARSEIEACLGAGLLPLTILCELRGDCPPALRSIIPRCCQAEEQTLQLGTLFASEVSPVITTVKPQGKHAYRTGMVMGQTRKVR